MKKLILIALISVIIIACKQNGNVWTKEYEQKQFDEIYTSLQVSIKDPGERKLFTAYIIKNLKKKLPNGLGSVPADSLRKLSFDLGREYTLNNKLHSGIAWTAELERSFRNGLEQEVAKKMPDKKQRDIYCDCLMAEVKKRYPDSLYLPLPDTAMTTIAKACNKSK